jgi:glyoxylase-like metal-dependent hydrolase (beta-lactamase superfamily II)
MSLLRVLLLLLLLTSCGSDGGGTTVASTTDDNNLIAASPSNNVSSTNVNPTPAPAPVSDTLPPASANTIELWQLPSQSPLQMMSYVVRRGEADLVVIDGGQTADAEYLRAFLKGRTVNAWIITHTHPDHVNALITLLESNTAPKIERIYWGYVDRAWLTSTQASGTRQYDRFLAAVKAAQIPLVAPAPGDRFTVGKLDFVVLSAFNPELPGLNNSSLVFKLLTPQTVLFLADVVDESVLLSKKRDLLPSDIVQMSHHGQTGLTKEIYKVINPSICLWPTTRGLWDNDNGNGFDSGPYTTLETRSWMYELGVEAHILQADGLQKVVLAR